MKHLTRVDVVACFFMLDLDFNLHIFDLFSHELFHANRPNNKPAPHKAYGVPQQSYGVPQQSYGNPHPSYGVPHTGYGTPQQRISGSASQYHPQYVNAPDDHLVCKWKSN